MPDPLPLSEVLREEYRSLRTDFPAAAGADEAQKLKAIYSAVHAREPLAALCISGGGIRSATFALGVLQGLARYKLLDRFDYLSTVSGGGYVGGWLTAWIHHQRAALEKAQPATTWEEQIERGRTAAAAVAGQLGDSTKIPGTPLQAEPRPVAHLREYSNYLDPKVGLLSADTWTLATIVGRNILLNWMVLFPLLMAALMVPRILVAALSWDPPVDLRYLLGAGLVLMAASIINLCRLLPSDGGGSGTQEGFLKQGLAPWVLAVLLFSGCYYWPDQTPRGSLASMAAAGAVVPWAAWIVYRLLFFRERGTVRELARLSLAILCSGGLAGLLLWGITGLGRPGAAVYVSVAAPLLVMVFAIAGAVFVGLSSLDLDDEDREWLSRAGAWAMLSAVVWGTVSALVLLAPELLAQIPRFVHWALASVGGLSGILSAWAGHSGVTDSGRESKETKTTSKAAGWMSWALKLAAPTFVVLFVVGLSLLTNVILIYGFHQGGPEPSALNHVAVLEQTTLRPLILLTAILVAQFYFLGYFVNINKFSLHGMYRNRLIRAYLGAPRLDDRRPDRFTGFDPNDNIAMHHLHDLEDATPPRPGPRPAQKPLHVVNMALNLVAGDNLAWQKRKAESFTASPLHAGCGDPKVGYRPCRTYGSRKRGISLGTAVAISGAAASPSMGYHSSPVVTFLMTLFNARLGWWLGNPRGAKWENEGPTNPRTSLLNEAFGFTDNTNEYIYLSDGGHFENLALYEMVRRRCRFIVLSDAGCDPAFNFEDLVNAIRKIRVDFGIPVEFEAGLFDPLRRKEKRCAVGMIGYSKVDGQGSHDGVLIYLKPMHAATDPPDVSSYQSEHTDFPHQSTGDQWFDEAQFESYRMLGFHSVREVAAWEAREAFSGLDDLRAGAERYIRGLHP
ncbi:MAG: patatin-like phospholipase family protein [Acidobacteria bacterium]|nr:patatin-like phospholipase family protein [Acidobacteriota bacterium]